MSIAPPNQLGEYLVAIADDMAAYDQLPSSIRRALANAVNDYSALAIFEARVSRRPGMTKPHHIICKIATNDKRIAAE